MHTRHNWELQTSESNRSEFYNDSADVKCLLSGCNTSVTWTFNNTNGDNNQIGSCDVPLISLDFWQTDFDKNDEILEIYIETDNTDGLVRLGQCDGGEQDNYQNIYNCFEDVELTDIAGGEYPNWLRVYLIISNGVNRNWLDHTDGSYYLLDAKVTLWCSDYSQLDIIENIDPTVFDANIYSSWDAWIECSQVDCEGSFHWNIEGTCNVPRLSFYYITNS